MRARISLSQAFWFGAVSEPVTTRNSPLPSVWRAMTSTSAVPMPSKVAWLTKMSRASFATSASHAPVAIPASFAFLIAGARASGSLAATVMAAQPCWVSCSIISTWSAALPSVGPVYLRSTPSSFAASSAPCFEALK
jgi:hypothetical protein